MRNKAIIYNYQKKFEAVLEIAEGGNVWNLSLLLHLS